jgi:Flp pilus assembly secretin CpaC
LANKTRVDAAVEKADIGFFNNMGGVSLLSTPSVSTQPGTKANIEIVREFPYPIKFDPAIRVSNSSGATVTVPTTPTDFATKDVGVSAEITPTINAANSPDPGKIVLNGKFSVIDFEGFIKSNVDNINMPSFETRESLFIEGLDNDQEKGLWIPGEHVALQDPTASNFKPGRETTVSAVKKRYLLFVSASLVK